MIRSDEVTFGADIEHFIALKPPEAEYEKYGFPYNPRDIIPCVGLCEGTKEKPWSNPKWTKGYALQEDNVMLEYNVPVTTTPKDFRVSIKQAQRYARGFLTAQGKVLVMDQSEHEFLPKQLTSPQATTFGCDADFDAYEMGRKRTNVPDFGNIRTCGGHFHIGGNFKCPDWVAVLFFELVLFHNHGPQWICPRGDSARRGQWYGRPGIYRSKPYGIEYRTLSNWWTSDPHNGEVMASRLQRTAKTLIETPAQIIQTAFRTVEWTRVRRSILGSYKRDAVGKFTKQGQYERMKDMEALAQQYSNLTLEI